MSGPPRYLELQHKENVVTTAEVFIQTQWLYLQHVMRCRQKVWQTGTPIQVAHRDQISLRHPDAGSATLERHLGGSGNCQQCAVQTCMCPPCVHLHRVLRLYDRVHDH
ncbi:Os01g0902000 [Oryza sativa Japonica Group]|uniref:Os01g0902000 protein n=3 Tax=Oryza TaxID=4527 RepID=Q0JGU9_ORYSJ|nr:hypothetical protein EE612_007423 [Oryza sativa]BAF07029.1 Os01g0902000 [Oryza sativa Japonica Group]BAS75761.1 Os01g0902000 [Oryza sativa Japonica Group]|eukprot:NP_001045115.1 Os01g0902000 [Oryza sativa Japonica Group]